MAIGYLLKASYKIDYIATGVASGKAMPEIFGKVDHKGMGIVAVMDGTGAEEPIALFFEFFGKAPVGDQKGNRDGVFQVLKQ